VEASRSIVKQVCARAAKLWELPDDAVEYVDGSVRPAGDNAGKHPPMTLKQVAAMAGKTGGPIVGSSSINAHGAAPSFGVHVCDLEVDPQTGKATIIRYTVIQDAGRAIHPAYVEGQYQGGAVQGIGWALNEEYIYGADGKMQNAGFLDYRIPVASDLPMIDTVIVEVANPRHPYGVRGIGETPIVPPMAAISNAMTNATGLRFTALPMSPPKVLAAIEAAQKSGDKNLKLKVA
jgi:CO/xanthine dehydrogenase Mo-binding subunit